MLDIAKLAIVLTVVTCVAGLAIGWTYDLTKDRIREQAVRAETEALSSVFPEGATIEAQAGQSPLPDRYWIARKDDNVIGYAFQDSARGFENDIKIVVGIAPNGEILGMNVLAQKETPGLGDRVREVSSSKYIWNPTAKTDEDTRPWFTAQFSGLNVKKAFDINKTAGEWHGLDGDKKNELKESNTITAITGATISSKAVVKAVSGAIPRYLAALNAREAAPQTPHDEHEAE